MKVEFYKHNLCEKDISNVVDVLQSTFITSGGIVKAFEKKFSIRYKYTQALAVSSCTAALHLSLIALGVTKGDEVITTPLSFIATANSIEYVGAKPIFVDVDSSTGLIDADRLEEAITSKTKAIVVVHLYGQLCDMKKIRKIANKYNLKIIEDAAHAVESQRDDYQTGTHGDFTCYSFYATKNLTCGEGGMIAFQNKSHIDTVTKLRLHGMSTNAADRYTKLYKHYDMDLLGYKYNMTNISAAMLTDQIDRLDQQLIQREVLCQRYEKAFQLFKGINLIEIVKNSRSARHLFTILVDPIKRDDYIKQIQKAGIGVAVNFRVIHLMRYYREKYGYTEGSYPEAEKIGSSTITLPLYPKLSFEEQDYVISVVKQTII